MPTYLLQGAVRELSSGPVDPGFGVPGPDDPDKPPSGDWPGIWPKPPSPPNVIWPLPPPPSPPLPGHPLPRPPFLPVDPDWGVGGDGPPIIWPPIDDKPVGRVWLLIYNRDLGWRYVLLGFPEPAPQPK